MGLLSTIILIASVYLFVHLTTHKCKKAMIVIEGENIKLTCIKCGRSLTMPGKVFEDKFGITAQEYINTKGYYISF